MKEIQTKRTPRFRRWCRKGYAAFASLRRQVTIGVLSVSMSTILLSTTTPVQAQTVDSLTIARELEIEKVEVTGVKATPTRSTMSSTSVFDRKAGASAPVQTLESVLRLSPAIDLRERSGRGTQADIMIRGGSFDQTMVMLNGINFTDARTGHQSHSLPIDIDCIAGIDLIDGVSGVGAYAGALNIRTMPLKSRYLRIEAAGGASISIQFTSYNASTGELLFNANSSQVIDIPTYIRSLQNCGVFSTVSYTGYTADDNGYSIDLRCILAAPQ